MAVCYKKLWKLLIDKNMSKTQLIKAAKISTNAMAQFHRQHNQIVRIKEMNSTVALLFSRSTYMRIHDKWDNRGTDRTVADYE